MNRDKIDQIFNHHTPPNESVVALHLRVRLACKALAEELNTIVPDCHEKLAAMESLRATMMYANAGIAIFHSRSLASRLGDRFVEALGDPSAQERAGDGASQVTATEANRSTRLHKVGDRVLVMLLDREDKEVERPGNILQVKQDSVVVALQTMGGDHWAFKMTCHGDNAYEVRQRCNGYSPVGTYVFAD